MRLYALVLFILAVSMSLPASAECTKTIATSVYNQYAFAEIGTVFYDKPVVQTDLAFGCGDMTYDLWNSSQFSGPGAYGHRGAGDEFDLTATFNHTYDTGFGPIAIEVSGAYWLVDNFSRMNDDYFAFHEQIGRPFEFGSVTMMPYIRASEWIGLNGVDYWLARPGAVMSIKLDDTWAIGADASLSRDLQRHRDFLNATTTMTHDFGDALYGYGSVSVAQHMSPVFGIGFRKTF